MRKADWEARVEQEFGEPTETLIPRLLNENRRMEDVAELFNVNFMTIYRWCERRNVERVVTYVFPEPADVAQE